MRRTGRYVFTSESVTEGHPDKIADQVSDAILDAVLEQDPGGRVACETLLTTGLIVLAGEITTTGRAAFADVARAAVRDVGYTRAKYGFDADTCAVVSALHGQSPDIAMGVDPGGAGDQGLMFGYACSETDELMPLPIMLAHRLVRALSEARRDGRLDYLRPDGKSQVTVEYDGDRPARIDAVVVSSQHSADVAIERIRADVRAQVIEPVVPAALMDERTRVFRQSDRPLRHRRPARRLRRDGAQDHRRHLRRHGAPRRGRVLRQGPDQGRPLGLLHGPLHRQELRRRGPRGARAGPARVRHRRGGPGLDPGGDLRHGPGRRVDDRRTGARATSR